MRKMEAAMSEKIRLKDGTKIEALSISSIGLMTVLLDSAAELQTLKELLTDTNLSDVKILNAADNVTGIYENLAANDNWSIKWTEDGIEAAFGFREKTKVELEIEALKKDQEISSGAVDALAGTVGKIAEAITSSGTDSSDGSVGGV